MTQLCDSHRSNWNSKEMLGNFQMVNDVHAIVVRGCLFTGAARMQRVPVMTRLTSISKIRPGV